MDKDYEIKQDGTEAIWGDGAIRYNKNKGRYDLIPWDVVERLIRVIERRPVRNRAFSDIDIIDAIRAQDIRAAILKITGRVYLERKPDDVNTVTSDELKMALYKMLGDLAIHFQKGAEKYGERNCEKGIPLWSFLDSGFRHTMQFLQGMTDEPHHISAIWNFVMADWTMNNHPEWCDEKKNVVDENTTTDDEIGFDEDGDTSDECEDDEQEPKAVKIMVLSDHPIDHDRLEYLTKIAKDIDAVIITAQQKTDNVSESKNNERLTDFDLENATIIGSQKNINDVKQKINEKFGSINLKLADKNYINEEINKAIHEENEILSSKNNKFDYMDTDLATKLHKFIRLLSPEYNVVVVRFSPVCVDSKMTEALDIESNGEYIRKVMVRKMSSSGRIEHFHVYTLYQKLMTHLMSITPNDYDDITTTCVINLMRFIEDFYFNKEE